MSSILSVIDDNYLRKKIKLGLPGKPVVSHKTLKSHNGHVDKDDSDLVSDNQG